MIHPRHDLNNAWYDETQFEILQVGDPILRVRARELLLEEISTPKIQKLIKVMKKTMRNAPGVGLAAPQIGCPLQITVIEDLEEYQKKFSKQELDLRERKPIPFHVIINPKITIDENESIEFFEGCLSFKGYCGIVPRARKVHVEYLNEKAEAISIDATGWYARILQHEIDHLHGTIYVDRFLTRSLTTTINYEYHWHNKSIKTACQPDIDD